MKTFDNAKTKTKRNKKWDVIKIKDYVFYIWLLPLFPFVFALEKFNNWRYNRLEWNEEKATKILDTPGEGREIDQEGRKKKEYGEYREMHEVVDSMYSNE